MRKHARIPKGIDTCFGGVAKFTPIAIIRWREWLRRKGYVVQTD